MARHQMEIYFSIVQRKVLTPNDSPCLEAAAQRYFESIALPFEWTSPAPTSTP
jgi:hypothetical protein